MFFLGKAVSKRVQTRTCSLYVERERVRRSQCRGFFFWGLDIPV